MIKHKKDIPLGMEDPMYPGIYPKAFGIRIVLNKAVELQVGRSVN